MKKLSKKKRIILIFIFLILIGLGVFSYFYIPWHDGCRDVNTNYQCGHYDCSVIGYFTNHNLCRN